MSGESHVLLAAVFYQRQQDGSRKRYHRGDTITGLSADKVARLRRIGAIGTPDDLVAAEPDPVPDPPDTDGDGDDGDAADDNGGGADDGADDGAGSDDGGKPETDANKPKLVAWLIANTVKDDGSDYTATELNRLNKPALWDLINSVED